MGPEISSLCCGVRKDVLWKLTFLVKSVEILILWLKNCVYHSINHFAWFVVVVCDADHNISGFPELRFYSHIILSVSKVQKDLILSLFFFFIQRLYTGLFEMIFVICIFFLLMFTILWDELHLNLSDLVPLYVLYNVPLFVCNILNYCQVVQNKNLCCRTRTMWKMWA